MFFLHIIPLLFGYTPCPCSRSLPFWQFYGFIRRSHRVVHTQSRSACTSLSRHESTTASKCGAYDCFRRLLFSNQTDTHFVWPQSALSTDSISQTALPHRVLSPHRQGWLPFCCQSVQARWPLTHFKSLLAWNGNATVSAGDESLGDENLMKIKCSFWCLHSVLFPHLFGSDLVQIFSVRHSQWAQALQDDAWGQNEK